jgi:hypothetical protein
MQASAQFSYRSETSERGGVRLDAKCIEWSEVLIVLDHISKIRNHWSD